MVAEPEDDVVVLANEGVLVAHLALPAAAVAARHRRLHGGTKPFRSLPGSCEPAVRMYGELTVTTDGLYDSQAAATTTTGRWP
jgi:hypothetical protein